MIDKAASEFDNLAKLIKEAAKVREQSYVSKPTEAGSDSILTTYGEYKLSISEACDQVAKDMGLNKQSARLADLMLFSYWNDALDWADTQLHPDEMLFVEACYRVANELFDQPSSVIRYAESSKLTDEFIKSAKKVRESLYDFGESEA